MGVSGSIPALLFFDLRSEDHFQSAISYSRSKNHDAKGELRQRAPDFRETGRKSALSSEKKAAKKQSAKLRRMAI